MVTKVVTSLEEDLSWYGNLIDNVRGFFKHRREWKINHIFSNMEYGCPQVRKICFVV